MIYWAAFACVIILAVIFIIEVIKEGGGPGGKGPTAHT
jgi:hypothetical protein